MKKAQIMRFWAKAAACLATLLLLLSSCGRNALPDSQQAVTSSGISSAASSTPAASPAPTEDPSADKMPCLFEEYISLPEHETLVPTEEQKQQLEAFIGRNPEDVCRFLDNCYGATSGICLLDITGDGVPEICVSGWMSNDVSSTEPLAELGSKTTIAFDLATGEYKGNFEGSPEDFYWCETESGSRVALGFELNWTRSYRSGPDVWLRTHILWEHKWQDGKIYSIPQWFYLYQSQDIDDTTEKVETYSNLDPELDAVQEYRMSTDKEGTLEPMLAGSSSGLSPEIIASLGKIKPLPTKLCLYAGVDCKDGTIVFIE